LQLLKSLSRQREFVRWGLLRFLDNCVQGDQHTVMKAEKYPSLPVARTSHKPPLKGRQSGSPTGQPY
jgi:hypothetical protein